MDKRLIAERFAKARGTYDREARVQQQVAEKMMQLILQHTGENSGRYRNVVEFGCGTGSYSSLLLHTLKPDTLLLNVAYPKARYPAAERPLPGDGRMCKKFTGYRSLPEGGTIGREY